MRHFVCVLSLSALSLALLSACSEDDAPVGFTVTPPSGSVTVTPSLGKVANAAVEIRCAATGSTLGSGVLGASGSIPLTLTGGCSGPVVIELFASAASTYFDEQSNAVVSLPAGTQLRALVPTLAAVTGNIAVTPLTEVAFRQALTAAANNESAITAAQVTTANGAVAAQVFGAAAAGINILQVPTLWDAALTTGSLGDTPADRYAFLLAALAGLGSASGTPALAATTALATDLADGVVNGVTSADVTYTSGDLLSQLEAEFDDFASYANTALQNALGIEPDDGGDGGDEGTFPNEHITLPAALTTLLPASELGSVVGTYTGTRASISEGGTTTPYNSCSIVVAANGAITVSANGQSITQTVDAGNGDASSPAHGIDNSGTWGLSAGGAPGTNVPSVNLSIGRHKMVSAQAYIVANTSVVPTTITQQINCYMPINRVVTAADSEWNSRGLNASASDYPAALVGTYTGTLFSENVGGSAVATPSATCSIVVASDGEMTVTTTGNPHPVSMTTQIAGDKDDQASFINDTDWALRGKDVTEPVGNGYDSIVLQHTTGGLTGTASRKAANVNAADGWACTGLTKQP